jgi:N-carbamoylputrescine amidase
VRHGEQAHAMSELVIAAVAAPFGRDMEACLRTIERVFGEARVCGARLVVLPEAALGGYVESLPAGDDVAAPPALDPDGPELRRLAELAGDLTVCVGFAEDGGDGIVHNVAACVSGDGLLGLHRKVHLPLALGRTTTPGDALAAFDTPVGRIGMLVSYDKAFPEAARTLALDGAQILAFLSAWPCGRTNAAARLQEDRQWRLAELWDRARAAENQVVVASANQTGSFGSLRFLGGARIVGPGGDPLAATGIHPGLALASVDVAGAVARARRSMAAIRDRRPDVYRLSEPLAV